MNIISIIPKNIYSSFFKNPSSKDRIAFKKTVAVIQTKSSAMRHSNNASSSINFFSSITGLLHSSLPLSPGGI